MANDVEQMLHIAMFPWLAFGHMIPFLEPAKLMAQKGHHISFISTPRNIDRLPKLPLNLSPFISFIKLPLPHSHNLSQKAEVTKDLLVKKISFLKNALDGLQVPITQFLQSSKPDWLLYDFVPYWLPNIVTNLRIPNAFFSIYIPACLTFVGSSLIPDDGKEPEDFTVPPKCYDVTVDNDVSDTHRFTKVLSSCDVVAVRGCMEFDFEWFQLLEDIHRKPALPVGLLPITPDMDDVDDNVNLKPVKEWLDMQHKASVVYVAFGSEAEVRQDELNEIALGLELSRVAIFLGAKVEILAHDSVGGFLTHGGWSSAVDALQFEKPLVLLTFFNDQGLNAKLLEEKMIGYVIPREERDGLFTRESLAESVKLVVVKEEGQIYREKAKEMKPLFADRKLQDNYVDNFLGYLKTHTRPKEEEEEDKKAVEI
ncbi:hypothetical protein FNV43_RR17461 [Rhamnella rubrinervis]|uniref:Uncharacterized protein n=1 Tax=Rhamnella rubrinervis TaxID=2594499 RepID=A0A8K0E2M1_9ROSA|nr:hypothetical protein FNV43_RR17461 [Rhamnella rubrinervis]